MASRLGRLLACAAILAASMAAAPPAAAGPAQDLISSLASDAKTTLNDRSLAADARAERLKATLGEVIDKKRMARSMMGRYWRRADKDQQARLIDLLETYLINVYASRVDDVEGDIDVAIDGERDVGGRTLVDSRVIRPTGPAVDVDWQVEEADGRLYVSDIVVEGVSLIVSQRAELASVIRRQGGIDGLIGILEKKVGG